MAFKKTNKAEDHAVVKPTEDDLRKSAALRDQAFVDQLHADVERELQSRDKN